MDDDLRNRLAKEVALDLNTAFGIRAIKVTAFRVKQPGDTKALYGLAAGGVLNGDEARGKAVIERIKSICDRPGFGLPGRIMIMAFG